MVKSVVTALFAAAMGSALVAGCSVGDPFDFGGPRSCEVPDQNEWVYGLMQEAYLWADELPQIDPLDYDTPEAMVAELRVGHDRWSRVSDKARSDALFQEGKVVGLGFRTRRDPLGRVVVATVDEGSPAAAAGMKRGDVIQSVGGLFTEQIDEENRWGDVYGESEPGVAVDLHVEEATGEVREVSLVKDWISIVTVPTVRIHEVEGRPVGYVVLATFVDTSTDALNGAFAELKAAGVREVVVDLRYNSGGLVSVARHFMHLLAGGVAEGRMAYQVRYNDAFADENDERELMRLDHTLPAVDHVVFVTTGTTLSASELLINAVAAHVPVSIVGNTTGGKPVGSKHFDFCDKIAVPITFRLLNADGVGDYYDGLPPTCAAPDDLMHELGDAEEGSLATALHLLATEQCLAHPGDDEGEGAGASEPPGLRDPRSAPSRRVPPPSELETEWPELGGLR
ncbi:S41 family peptidase [Paraliomyxa miuraensis]|uniref:S41 family peptidase n=1 Tax=Paraliomyxa miuraensis TaxID=376150 RepID=UPI00225123A9|nr:S41 family peptidase [Paraliomyxa miuraensis]MCX4242428.1 S41 family peptidase [Paraliomyxa miuraensis]